jgi:hypothetical protein
VKRLNAQRGLFLSIAFAAAILILRHPLGQLAYEVFKRLDTGYDSGWATFGQNLVEDRWALAAAVLCAIYFTYKLVSSPKKVDSGSGPE